MDEETTLPAQASPDQESQMAAGTTETPADQAADGSVIYEDLFGSEIEETTAEVVITIEEIQAIGSDILHADLFGSFLICGTLIGLALLRKIHGT